MLNRIVNLVTIMALFTSVSLAEPPELQALRLAARTGNMPVVRQLLDAGLDPAMVDINGATAVHAAAGGGQLEALKLLLERGGPADLADKQGRRPLYEAATANSGECCALLLAKGADIEATTGGDWTPLKAALVWRKDQAALVLISSGAICDLSPTVVGETPLMVASFRGPKAVAEALLARGADPGRRDQNEETALHHAARGGQSEIAALLQKEGLTSQTPNAQGWTALELALQGGHQDTVEVLFETIGDTSAALPGVCAWGTSIQVDRLLLQGADPNGVDRQGHPVLAIAAGRGGDSTLWESRSKIPRDSQDLQAHWLVVRLLETGANLEKAGVSALQAACRADNTETARRLLELGVDPNQPGPEGDAPVLLAVERGNLELRSHLLARGAHPSPRDASGLDPLMRLDRRISKLGLALEGYRRMRALHPALNATEAELVRLTSAREALQ